MSGFSNPSLPNPTVFPGNVNTSNGALVTATVFAFGVISTESGYGVATALSAAVTNPAVSSGTAFTPSATVDTMVYVPIAATTTGTVKITMGPTTGAETTVVPTSNLVAASEPTFTLRVPNGWKVIVTITGTTVAIGTVTAITC